jgi:SAM-dependent methyltransferase
MKEFWESRFKEGKALWGFEPADSAILALEIFKSRGFRNILVPGFGYGRNAKLFCDNGFKVTGIEISGAAIGLAESYGLPCFLYHGSVTAMPFDSQLFDGIFCYALIHLLSKYERYNFLKACYKQLKPEGIMIFVVTSKELAYYGTGKYLSKDRFQISNGLQVFFYDQDSIRKEFSPYGLVEFYPIREPVKFMENEEPIKMLFVICRKMNSPR